MHQIKRSLSGLPVFLKRELLRLILLRGIKKAKRFASFFAVLRMVDVVRVNHSLQVPTSILGAPLQSLVHDHVVKHQVEYAVTKDT